MSGRIPQNFIDDLLQRVDIVDFIGSRVPLKKAGRNYSACCPFHDEKTPSFTVTADKQMFYCFGCHAGGNVLGFAMEYHNVNFPDSIELVAKEVGIEVPREATRNDPQASLRAQLIELTQNAASLYQQNLQQHRDASAYLKQRGIDETTRANFNIGVARDSWDQVLRQLGKTQEQQQRLEQAGLTIKRDGKDGYYDRFRDRIMFPIRDTRGRTIAFGGRVMGNAKPKYLNSPETPIFHKSRELYGLYEALQAQRNLNQLIIVEGYMDVVALAQHGVSNAVATLGTAVGGSHFDKLFRYTANLVCCFDGDNAGRSAARRALDAALPHMIDGRSVSFLFLDEGEDPDTIVQKKGNDGFNVLVRHAMPLSEYLFTAAAEGREIQTLEDKSFLNAQASPLIAKLPKNAFRALVEQECERRTGSRPQLATTNSTYGEASFAPPLDPAFDKGPPADEHIPFDDYDPAPPDDEEHIAVDGFSQESPPGPSWRGGNKRSPSDHLIALLFIQPSLARVPLPANLSVLKRAEGGAEVLDLLEHFQNSENLSASDFAAELLMSNQGARLKRYNELSSRKMFNEESAKTIELEFQNTLALWLDKLSYQAIQNDIAQLQETPYEEQTLEQKQALRALFQQRQQFNSNGTRRKNTDSGAD